MKVVIGQGSCGIATGAKKTSNEFERLVAEKKLDNVVIDKTGCIGTCYLEPIVDVYKDNGELEARYVKLQPEKVAEVVEKHLIGGEPVAEYTISEEDKTFLSQQRRVVLRNCGLINPEKIDEYIAKGGYEAAKKVITTMTQDEVIEVVKVSGLRGRGGAGFPTWFKWDAARKAEGEHKHLICNADEGDPGAFMDRAVIESDPHTLIEACSLALCHRASDMYVYIRAEYPLAVERLSKAIEQARSRGLLGENILGTGFSCDLNIKIGAAPSSAVRRLPHRVHGRQAGHAPAQAPFPAQKGYLNEPPTLTTWRPLPTWPGSSRTAAPPLPPWARRTPRHQGLCPHR